MRDYEVDLDGMEIDILKNFLQSAIGDGIISSPEGIYNTNKIIKKLELQYDEYYGKE